MGEGWRIQLRADIERGTDGVKIDTRRRYGIPYLCRQCGANEATKHYHLTLDDAGATIVSDDVAEELQMLGFLGGVFEVTNRVVGPPPQEIKLWAEQAVQDFRLIEATA